MITQEELRVLKILSELPSKGNVINLSEDYIRKIGISDEEFIEALILLSSKNIIDIKTLPMHPRYADLMKNVIRSIDIKYLTGTLTDVEYTLARLNAAIILLSTYNENISNIPLSPKLIFTLAGQLIIYLETLIRRSNKQTREEISKNLSEIINVLNRALVDNKVLDEVTNFVNIIRERIEEVYLRYKIGEISKDEFVTILNQFMQRVSKIESIFSYITQQSIVYDKDIQEQVEVLKTRRKVGEITSKEYIVLYNQLINRARINRTSIKITDEYFLILSKLLESIKKNNILDGKNYSSLENMINLLYKVISGMVREIVRTRAFIESLHKKVQ